MQEAIEVEEAMKEFVTAQLMEEGECEEVHIMVDVNGTQSHQEPGEILSTADEQMEDHDAMDVDHLNSQWIGQVPSKIAVVEEVGKIALEPIKQEPGGDMEVGEGADSVGLELDVQEPGDITEDAEMGGSQSEQEGGELGGMEVSIRDYHGEGHINEGTAGMDIDSADDDDDDDDDEDKDNKDDNDDKDNKEDKEDKDDKDEAIDDSDTDNYNDGVDGSPEVGSKQKSIRISNACYRKRSHAKSSHNNAVVSSSTNHVGCVTTVGHLYVTILNHHSVLNFSSQLCSGCDQPSANIVQCEKCSTACCFSEPEGSGCVYFAAEQQELRQINGWLCPEHYAQECHVGNFLKVIDSNLFSDNY